MDEFEAAMLDLFALPKPRLLKPCLEPHRYCKAGTPLAWWQHPTPFHIQKTLDLHGMTQECAHRATLGFLTSATRQACQLVAIIPGHAKHRSTPPVLKPWLLDFLPQQPSVKAFIAQEGLVRVYLL